MKPSGYGEAGPSFDAKLRRPGADWFSIARDLIAGGREPELGQLLSLDVNAMTGEDLVHAYVFAAYLLEGRPDGWDRLIAEIGAGTPVDAAVRKALGRPTRDVGRRVRRWLEERE